MDRQIHIRQIAIISVISIYFGQFYIQSIHRKAAQPLQIIYPRGTPTTYHTEPRVTATPIINLTFHRGDTEIARSMVADRRGNCHHQEQVARYHEDTSIPAGRHRSPTDGATCGATQSYRHSVGGVCSKLGPW